MDPRMQAGLRGSHQPKSHFGVVAFNRRLERTDPRSLFRQRHVWRPAPAALAARRASPSLLQTQPVLVCPVCGSLPCPSRARAPFCRLLRRVNVFSSCLLNLRLFLALRWTCGLVPFVVGGIRRCCCLRSFRPKSSSSAPLVFCIKIILVCSVFVHVQRVTLGRLQYGPADCASPAGGCGAGSLPLRPASEPRVALCSLVSSLTTSCAGPTSPSPCVPGERDRCRL